MGVSGPDAEDVVQETLLRLWRERGRLTRATATGFALVTARNLAVSFHRAERTRTRQQAELPDPTPPPAPDESAELAAHREALRAAVQGLPAAEREALLAHTLDGVSTVHIAQQRASTPGGVAAQLARARARTRLDYVLALRRVVLPTPRCRPVLLALSTADARRLRETGAARHLLTCEVCAALQEPLARRHAGLAWSWPLGLGGGLLVRWLAQSRQARTVQLAGGTTAAVTVAAVAGAAALVPAPVRAPVAAPAPVASPRPPSGDGSVVVGPPGGRVVGLPFPSGFALAGAAGVRALLVRASVLAVPADEGFWVGDAGARVWVELRTSGGRESSVRVRTGDRVSGPAVVRSSPGSWVRGLHVGPADAALLSHQRAHLEVPAGGLRVVAHAR